MTINLQQFCATHDVREYLHQPFVLDGHTHATDGRILVRVSGGVRVRRRYRFIRDADRSDAFLPIGSLLCYSMDSLDDAIDAAMGLTRPAEES